MPMVEEIVKQQICACLGIEYPSMKKSVMKKEFDPETGELIGETQIDIDASPLVNAISGLIPYIQNNAMVPPGIALVAGGFTGATTAPGQVI
uniref:Uncharacterized protein n=1 Tax=candidate division WOR-3 bacterium TaxID=2052148 RepID=A0A7C6EBI9_UNCW3